MAASSSASTSNSMAGIFRSSRLVYRAIEETDDPFLHQIQSDVEALANSTHNLLVPETKAASRKWREHLEKQLIAVIVCLPAEEASSSSQTTDTSDTSKTQQQEGPALTPVGCISLTDTRPDRKHHRNADISIDIVAKHRGKGYGSEAIRWILDWAFRVAALHRVGIQSYSWNEGAVKLYPKLGFILEGRKREEFWYNGGWHDELEYAILENEWQALKEKEQSS